LERKAQCLDGIIGAGLRHKQALQTARYVKGVLQFIAEDRQFEPEPLRVVQGIAPTGEIRQPIREEVRSQPLELVEQVQLWTGRFNRFGMIDVSQINGDCRIETRSDLSSSDFSSERQFKMSRAS